MGGGQSTRRPVSRSAHQLGTSPLSVTPMGEALDAVSEGEGKNITAGLPRAKRVLSEEHCNQLLRSLSLHVTDEAQALAAHVSQVSIGWGRAHMWT